MHRKPLLLLMILVAAGFIVTALADVPLRFTDLPPAVQKTIAKEANGSPIGGLSREVERGKVIYEAEFEKNGHAEAISVDHTGAVVETEAKLEIDDLPGHARFAIEKAKYAANLLRLLYRTTVSAN